jgi:hypothetical protein
MLSIGLFFWFPIFFIQNWEEKRFFCLSLVNFSEHKGFSRLWQFGC